LFRLSSSFDRKQERLSSSSTADWLPHEIYAVREAFALHDLVSKFYFVLHEVVKVMKFVKAGPLNCHLFAVLCEEMQAHHKLLLLRLEVRWLSKVKFLSDQLSGMKKSTDFYRTLFLQFINTF
jgi:hypothetical protein